MISSNLSLIDDLIITVYVFCTKNKFIFFTEKPQALTEAGVKPKILNYLTI